MLRPRVPPRLQGMEEGDDKPPPAKKHKPEETVSTDGSSQAEASTVTASSSGEPEEEKESENGGQYLMEKDVGITEYMSPQRPGFFAILKQRYSDFHVHELALDGSTAQLTDFSIPEDTKKLTTKLNDVFSQDDIDRLKTLSQNCKTEELVKIKVTGDKEKRTVIHRAIREHFPDLESKTEEGDDPDEKLISVQLAEKKPSKHGGRSRWPPERGNYCKFVLHKENKDTMDAVSLISHLLKVKPSTLHYAGTKDHRAVTSQHVTAFRVTAERLAGLNKTCRNVKLGNFEYVTEPLKLGDLTGNRFTVVLRQVSCDDHVINEAMTSLCEFGVINYFGMQRFGTSTIPTYQVGRCLLKSEWQGAIDLILKPRPNEADDVSSARRYYVKTKDAAGAAAKMPKWRSIEKNLLQGLARHADKANLLGALNFIPRNTRHMYVHSWQSLLWNKVVSWRMRELGRSVAVGDIVTKSKEQVEQQGDEKQREEVDFVTEQNVGLYSIEDVVMPLPGWDVQLPRNKCGEEYTRLLEEEGFSLEDMKHKVKDFSLPGSYRSVVIKPANITWSVFRYDDVTVPQVVGDLEAMDGKSPPQSLPDGKLKGLKLDFNLPPSSYATMVVRELTHMDTSSAYQASLNQKE